MVPDLVPEELRAKTGEHEKTLLERLLRPDIPDAQEAALGAERAAAALEKWNGRHRPSASNGPWHHPNQAVTSFSLPRLSVTLDQALLSQRRFVVLGPAGRASTLR